MIRQFLIFGIATSICFSAPVLARAAADWRNRASAEEATTSSDVAAEVAFGRNIAARILGRYKPYVFDQLRIIVRFVAPQNSSGDISAESYFGSDIT